MSDSDAHALIQEAWEAGLKFYDTAPSYGHGLSEARLGQGLRWKPRGDFILSTKVGRLLTPRARQHIDFNPWVNGLPFDWHFDYSYDGTMRSIEDSLQRTGLEYIDVALIHEIDVATHGAHQREIFEGSMNGAAKALLRLRDQGVVKSIGVGVNECDVAVNAIQLADFDCILLAGRYTLLEQHALDELFPLCEMRDVSVIVGGGYNSGVLATGAVPGAMYNYAPADDTVLGRVRHIENICKEFNVSLKSVALQFILKHPVVKTVIPGTRSISQLHENVNLLNSPIPAELWSALKDDKLIRDDSPVL